MYATLDTLKTFYSGNISGSLIKALKHIRGLNVNQAESLVSAIEANAFQANKGLFEDDTLEQLSYLDKLKILVQRRLDKAKFASELDADGLALTRSHTALSVGEYQRLFMLNTPYLDLVSLDFCHAVFVDFERSRILTYCEGDIFEKQANSRDQLIIAITKTIEWAKQEYDSPMIYETSLALAKQATCNANEN